MMKVLPRTRNEIGWFAARVVCLLGGLVFVVGCVTRMPGSSFSGPLAPLTADESLIQSNLHDHVIALAQTIGARNTSHLQGYEAAANYIESVFRKYGYEPQKLAYDSDGARVANIEVEIKGVSHPEEIIVVGAHYDSAYDNPGADDNASGVAGLLEIARMLAGSQPDRTIRLVAFANEEQPHFMRNTMGSYVYARDAKQKNEHIVGMMSVEMIGCYSDIPGSQTLPTVFKPFYSNTGNYVGFVGNLRHRALTRQALGSFRQHAEFPSEGVVAPFWVSGVSLSDHAAFWRKGYPAVMVTDTAFLRYHYYHTLADMPNRLDYERMAKVTAGLSLVVIDLATSSKETKKSLTLSDNSIENMPGSWMWKYRRASRDVAAVPPCFIPKNNYISPTLF